jgi:hypothetical protein
MVPLCSYVTCKYSNSPTTALPSTDLNGRFAAPAAHASCRWHIRDNRYQCYSEAIGYYTGDK